METTDPDRNQVRIHLKNRPGSWCVHYNCHKHLFSLLIHLQICFWLDDQIFGQNNVRKAFNTTSLDKFINSISISFHFYLLNFLERTNIWFLLRGQQVSWTDVNVSTNKLSHIKESHWILENYNENLSQLPDILQIKDELIKCDRHSWKLILTVFNHVLQIDYNN